VLKGFSLVKLKRYDETLKSLNGILFCHSRESGNPFPDQVEDKHFRHLHVPGFPFSRE